MGKRTTVKSSILLRARWDISNYQCIKFHVSHYCFAATSLAVNIDSFLILTAVSGSVMIGFWLDPSLIHFHLGFMDQVLYLRYQSIGFVKLNWMNNDPNRP